ncbi:MAG: hypothetical protein U1F68_10110 [Gammaproteobacteria bacterium]
MDVAIARKKRQPDAASGGADERIEWVVIGARDIRQIDLLCGQSQRLISRIAEEIAKKRL